jgi:hypothetical protein
VKLSELVGSDFVKDATRRLKSLPTGLFGAQASSPEEALRAYLCVEPSSIELVSLSARSEDKKGTIVFVSRERLDPLSVTANLSEALGDDVVKTGRHAGVDLYGAEGEEKVALAFPAPRVAVFGTADEVKAGLDRYRAGKAVAHEGPPAKLLGDAPPDATVVVALAPGVDMLDILPAAAGEGRGVETVLVMAKAGSELDLSVRVTARTDDDALKLVKEATDELERAKKSLEEFRKQLGPMVAFATMGPVRKLLRNVKIEGKGRTVDASVTVDPRVVASAQSLFLMTMTGALSGAAASRLPANESAAVARLRTYVNAQSVFRKVDHYGKGELVYASPTDGAGFPDLYEIGGPGSGGTAPKLIDRAFAEATGPESAKSGYYFVDITHDGGGVPYDHSFEFGLCAVPAEHGKTGRNTFVVDVTGAVFQRDNGGEPVTRFPEVDSEKDPWIPAGM